MDVQLSRRNLESLTREYYALRVSSTDGRDVQRSRGRIEGHLAGLMVSIGLLCVITLSHTTTGPDAKWTAPSYSHQMAQPSTITEARPLQRHRLSAAGPQEPGSETSPGGQKAEDQDGSQFSGGGYYKGFVSSPLDGSDGAPEKDNLTPTLKFMGYSALIVAGLFLAFMKSNGLI